MITTEKHGNELLRLEVVIQAVVELEEIGIQIKTSLNLTQA